MKKCLLIMNLCLSIVLYAQEKPAYLIYHKDGSPASWSELVKAASESQLVFFGELHNNPICHWLQLELTSELFTIKSKGLVLGAEMFETDGQLMLSEYIDGLIAERNFESEARLWPNYKTDYKPLVDYARKNKLRFIATNIPRRYAALVSKEGFEALKKLSPQALDFIAPLPIAYDSTLPGYKNMLNMGGHASPNLPKAQAIKDATMAWFLLKHYRPGDIFLHFNGAYHTDNFEGIVWYVNHYRPGMKILTLSSVEKSNLNEITEEVKGKADFIIVVPEAMTKTH